MQYAEVTVALPVRPVRAHADGDAPPIATFSYHIPPHLDVLPGHLVWVSFGAHQVQAIVLELSDSSPVLDTKPILAICDPQPYLTPVHLHLARWLAAHYICSIADAAFLFLPPGIARRSAFIVEPTSHPSPNALAALNNKQQMVWDAVSAAGHLSVDELARRTHIRNVRAVVDQLVRRGILAVHTELPPARVRPKLARTAVLAVERHQAMAEVARRTEPDQRRARVLRALLDSGLPLTITELKRQAQCPRSTITGMVRDGLIAEDTDRHTAVLAVSRDVATQAIARYEALPVRGAGGALCLLSDQPGPLDVAEISKATGVSSAQLQALADQGLILIQEHEVRRDPLARRSFTTVAAPTLTLEQQHIYASIRSELNRLSPAGGGQPRPILVHGVTGSGKTELYLRILSDALDMGRQAIIMVPEIALTPQTIQRFASRFPGQVAVLHSRLSTGEHFDEWRRIRDGHVSIVIGSRSAIFAPLPRLGLVIIDEEHEWTYKQSDTPPRYHAREVALKLAEMTPALVVMGSATPDVVSYQRAKDGEFLLLELAERVVRAPTSVDEGSAAGLQPSLRSGGPAVSVVESPLPPVEIIDLRQELRAGNRSIFSRSLFDAMTVALAAGQQIILFLNRRGTATFIMCRDCGHVLRCRKCDAPLGYHQAEDDLVCHQCNRRYLIPQVCPQCWSKRIKFFGIGTQKVEDEVHNLFPGARTLRWDRDVTGGRFAHETILDRFIAHDADILIGTQMIAKGLDLPLVTLVGVVSADTALHLPDFRAGERTFQILTQVAGRAGRSTLGGKVIIQTYSPEHYAIQAASRHDYQGFAAQELHFRADKGYPPFSRIARLLLQLADKDKAQAEAERMHQALSLRLQQMGLAETVLAGPAPCFVSRLRGRYRWQIVIQAPNPHPLLDGLPLPAGWIVDVDPVSLL